MQTDEKNVIDSIFVESLPSTGRVYEDDPTITCWVPFGNNKICGRKFSTFGRFLNHLKKSKLHNKEVKNDNR